MESILSIAAAPEAGRATQQPLKAADIAGALASAARRMAGGFGAHAREQGMGAARDIAQDIAHDIDNALKAPVFEVLGVKLVVAPVQHPGAHAALANRARALSGGRVIGMVTASGERRCEDLIAAGKACGEGCDEVVIFEADTHGRMPGEAAGLVAAGALAGMPKGRRVHCRPHADDALRHALSLCRRGDLVAVACAASLATVVHALRPLDSAAAYRVAVAARPALLG